MDLAWEADDLRGIFKAELTIGFHKEQLHIILFRFYLDFTNVFTNIEEDAFHMVPVVQQQGDYFSGLAVVGLTHPYLIMHRSEQIF